MRHAEGAEGAGEACEGKNSEPATANAAIGMVMGAPYMHSCTSSAIADAEVPVMVRSLTRGKS